MTALRPDFQAGSLRIAATGAVVGSQSGFVTNVVRTGVGVYELAIQPADPAQHTAHAQPIVSGAGKFVAAVEWTSDTLIRVRIVVIT